MNNKIDRPEGKFARNFKTVFDLKAMPDGLSTDLFVKLCDQGFIFYDSEKGNRPKLYEVGELNEEDKLIPVFVDTKGKEVSLEDFTKKLEDEEFWRKELYSCKQSPLYYFANYASPKCKPSQAEIDKFLTDNGFGAKADSEEAATVSEEVRKTREAFSEKITLEHLKDLKPVRDKMDDEYELETLDIQKEAAKVFDLSETHSEGIKKKVITAIMKTKTKEAPEELKNVYVNESSGRWDKSMFRATDLDVLLRLWKQL